MVRRSVGKVEIFDVCLEGGLVIFDREDVVCFFFPRPGTVPCLVGCAGHRG